MQPQKDKITFRAAPYYYEVKCLMETTDEKGFTKKANHLYTVDAMSWTEAEARATDELQPEDITAMSRAPYKDIALTGNPDHKYYKCKLMLIVLDGRLGREKKTPYCVLVQAPDLGTAKKTAEDFMKGSSAGYEIASVSETKIVDVLEYGA